MADKLAYDAPKLEIVGSVTDLTLEIDEAS